MVRVTKKSSVSDKQKKQSLTVRKNGKGKKETSVTTVSNVRKINADSRKNASKTTVNRTVVAVKSIKTNITGQDNKIKYIDLKGQIAGTVMLPDQLISPKINIPLITQAIRVFMANQRQGNASTKTRGEVEGSTRKIYRQKGTGRARHGGIRAPIFVGGGIVFGPKPRDYSLSLSKKLRRLAVASAFTYQLQNDSTVIVSDLQSMKPKTKLMADFLKDVAGDKKVLLLTNIHADTVVRAARNIENCTVMPIRDIHTYALMSHQKIVIMKEAIDEMITKSSKSESV